MAYPYTPGYGYQAPVYQQAGQYQQYAQPVPQQMPAPPVQQPNYICRPVASADEARAVQTDFSGAITIMPDIGHGCIYTKQLDFSTGAANFVRYQLAVDAPAKPMPAQQEKSQEFATKQDLEEVKQEFYNLMRIGGAANESNASARRNASKKPDGE